VYVCIIASRAQNVNPMIAVGSLCGENTTVADLPQGLALRSDANSSYCDQEKTLHWAGFLSIWCRWVDPDPPCNLGGRTGPDLLLLEARTYPTRPQPNAQ
jgi:hypothetical protein